MSKKNKRGNKKAAGTGRGSRSGRALFWFVFAELMIILVGIVLILIKNGTKDDGIEALLEQELTINYVEDEDKNREDNKNKEEVNPVPKPDIDEQILTINPYSRPGDKTDGVNYIVIHYLGNPKTTAQENHDYFESLKDLQNVSMSANYIVGLDGEIIHCVPDDEIAYASNSENHDSISIENCHMDETGKFNAATYESLVKLAAYLSEKYHVDRDHIIRHYDVTGKMCPIYYVEHEDKWEELKDDIMAYREACREEMDKQKEETEVDQLKAYLQDHAEEGETGNHS